MRGKIIADRIWQHEISVGETLHQRAGAQPVSAVVGEIGFAQHEQSRHRAHQIVIHPGAAHRVVDRRVNSHGRRISILTGNLFIHIEKISIAFANDVFAQSFDRVGKIQVNAFASGANAAAVVTHFLRGA